MFPLESFKKIKVVCSYDILLGGEELHDDPNNGCAGDYDVLGSCEIWTRLLCTKRLQSLSQNKIP